MANKFGIPFKTKQARTLRERCILQTKNNPRHYFFTTKKGTRVSTWFSNKAEAEKFRKSSGKIEGKTFVLKKLVKRKQHKSSIPTKYPSGNTIPEGIRKGIQARMPKIF